MTPSPKEKAKELYLKYKQVYNYTSMSSKLCDSAAKECAIIACQEITSLMIKFHGRHIENNLQEIKYYQQVKAEIENL